MCFVARLLFSFATLPMIPSSRAFDPSTLRSHHGRKLQSTPSDDVLDNTSKDQLFLQWAKANAVQITSTMHEPGVDTHVDPNALEAIGASIGDAEVVVLSEGFHN